MNAVLSLNLLWHQHQAALLRKIPSQNSHARLPFHVYWSLTCTSALCLLFTLGLFSLLLGSSIPYYILVGTLPTLLWPWYLLSCSLSLQTDLGSNSTFQVTPCLEVLFALLSFQFPVSGHSSMQMLFHLLGLLTPCVRTAFLHWMPSYMGTLHIMFGYPDLCWVASWWEFPCLGIAWYNVSGHLPLWVAPYPTFIKNLVPGTVAQA